MKRDARWLMISWGRRKEMLGMTSILLKKIRGGGIQTEVLEKALISG